MAAKQAEEQEGVRVTDVAVGSCPDQHIHVQFLTPPGAVIGELVLEPDEAYALARRIEAAADEVLGVH